MQVTLRGNSASTVVSGILLLTHAKRLGHPISVAIEGDPADVAAVNGPALVYSSVLSGCGVGRVKRSNSLVCVPGPAVDPLLVSLEHGGIADWFQLDRAGAGLHPSTRAVVQLCHHQQPEGQNLGRVLRGALSAVGCPAEPTLLDLLFGAPVDPLQRVALAIHAGRAMSQSRPDLFTRYIQSGTSTLPDPLPTPLSWEQFKAARASGELDSILTRLQPGLRDAVVDWLMGLEELDDTDGVIDLICSIAEVGSHLVSLPMAGMLPVLSPEQQAVASHLGYAIGAPGKSVCAMRALVDTFEFLGGAFVEHSAFAVNIAGDDPPVGRKERWEWLCKSAFNAKAEADTLWRKLIDPVQ